MIWFRYIRHTKCTVLWVPRTRIKNHCCIVLLGHNGGLWWRENDLLAELLVNPAGTVSAYWSISSFSRSNAWTTEACETSSDIACLGDAIFSSSLAPHVLFFICNLDKNVLPDLALKKHCIFCLMLVKAACGFICHCLSRHFSVCSILATVPCITNAVFSKTH